MGAYSAERLLSVIRALNMSGPSTVSELERQIGCSRQAIYRFMDVLLAHGYVVRLPDQPRYLYDCHALWLQTPHLPLKVRLAVDALAAALPKLMA